MDETQAKLNSHEQVCTLRYEMLCARLKRLENVIMTASGGSAATPTALGTVYGKQTTSGGTPYLTAYGYNAGTSTTGVNATAVGLNACHAIKNI